MFHFCMQEIPFLKVKDKRLSFDISSTKLRSLLDKINDKSVYVLDTDGLFKNHPNVSLYQRLTSVAELWVDAGPRTVDDIVDDLFSGAYRIVIRPDLWEEVDLHGVVDITENELLALYHSKQLRNGVPRDIIFDQAQGVVVHFDNDSEPVDFKMEGFIKQLAKTKPAYVLDETVEQRYRWEGFGLKGVVISIDCMGVNVDE